MTEDKDKFISSADWLDSRCKLPIPDSWRSVHRADGRHGWAEPPAKLLEFIAELDKLQERYGVILGHQDSQGAFEYEIDGDVWT